MFEESPTHRELLKGIVRAKLIDKNDSGEGIYMVLTKSGYIYLDIPEAMVREINPQLI